MHGAFYEVHACFVTRSSRLRGGIWPWRGRDEDKVPVPERDQLWWLVSIVHHLPAPMTVWERWRMLAFFPCQGLHASLCESFRGKLIMRLRHSEGEKHGACDRVTCSYQEQYIYVGSGSGDNGFCGVISNSESFVRIGWRWNCPFVPKRSSHACCCWMIRA